MEEKSLKSILYDRTVDYASRMVENEGVINFIDLKLGLLLILAVGKREDAKE